MRIDRSPRHRRVVQLRHLWMQRPGTESSALATGPACAAGPCGSACGRETASDDRFLLWTGIPRAYHQQRRDLQPPCDDGGLAHPSDRVARAGHESRNRQIGGGENQRPRSVREGSRNRSVARCGKKYRDRPSRNREGRRDARRSSRRRGFASCDRGRESARRDADDDCHRREHSAGDGIQHDSHFELLVAMSIAGIDVLDPRSELS